MSADNGVYVLQTYGPEFRVTYAQAIDNIFGKFNDETLHWDGDDKSIVEYFGQSEVFKTIDEALNKAELLAEEYEYLEDGVCVIREFAQKKFNEL